jgi:hypothetical protein
MITMIVNEVNKAIRQTTGWTEQTVQCIMDRCTTYAVPGEPLMVNADDLKEELVSRCSGTYFVWNTLISLVCMTIVVTAERELELEKNKK